jgi:hypothetical protein
MIWRDRKGRKFECAWGFPDEPYTAITVRSHLIREARGHETLRNIIGKRLKVVDQEAADGLGSVVVFSERYVEGLASLASRARLPDGWKTHLEAVCEAVLRGRIFGEDIFRAIGFIEGVLMAFGCVKRTELAQLERATSGKKASKP